MASETRLEYDRLPAVLPSYVRVATTLSGGLAAGETIPKISAEMPRLEVSGKALAHYRRVCGFSRSEQLPVTYPHVLAFPLHMVVMTHKQFPLKLLGLVHVRNDITQYRPIDADETLQLDVSVGGHHDVSRGIEFDLVTRVRDAAGDMIWHETGTMLSRRRSGSQPAGGKDTPKDGLSFEASHETRWDIPANIGRRYARAAGDYNPIHLSAWTAKLFGFPRAIATGMWTKARAAAALQPYLTQSAYTLSVGFKKPVFLPGTARFACSETAAGLDFGLTNDAGDVLHLTGDVAYLQT